MITDLQTLGSTTAFVHF